MRLSLEISVRVPTVQLLCSSVVVPPDSDTIRVEVTDSANSYVTLDAVMVQVLSVTSVPIPFPPLNAASGVVPLRGETAELTGKELVPLVAEATTRKSNMELEQTRVHRLTTLSRQRGYLPSHEDLDPVTNAHKLTAATPGTAILRLPAGGSDFTASVQTYRFAPTSESQAKAAPAKERARDNLFARVDDWLESDLDDSLDGPSDDDSGNADQDAILWPARS